MRVPYLIVVCLLALAVLFSTCGAPPKVQWETLDRYNFNVAEASPDFKIPARHLYEMIYFSRVAAAGGPVTDSTIRAFRDSVLVDTLVGLSLDRYDLPSHWYQYRDYRDRANTALAQLFWETQVGSKIVVDSAEVIKYYQDHPDEFSYPEQADIYHILSSPLGFLQGSDSALYERYTRDDLTRFSEEFVWRLYQLLLYGELFENVARDYSHDVHTRERGGHLGWTRRGVYVDPFDSVAFSLKDGEYSKPYVDTDGWHIIYRTRYNPGGPLPLDTASVWDRARNSVFNAKGSAQAGTVLDSLHAQAKVEFNPIVLSDTVIYLVDDTVWAAVINATDTIDALRLKGFEEDYRRSYGLANTTPEIRKVMVAHAAGPLLVCQAARHLGLDTLPKYVAAERQLWRETSKTVITSELYSSSDWAPSDSAVEQYYQDHFEEYNPDLHFTAEQLVIPELELAEFLREQTSSGFTLKYLYEYYGKGGEGYDIKYEDLGEVKKGQVDSVLYDAMRRTHMYRFTKVVKTPRGYHLAKILDRNYPRPLDVVRGEIRNKLVNQHRMQMRAAYRDSLFQAFDVRLPGILPPFELPRLSQRNHPRTLPKKLIGYTY